MDMGMVARSRRGRIESTSSAELCARLSDPRSQMVSLQWLFGKILKVIHENATATLPALGIWSNGFMTSRASRPLASGRRLLPKHHRPGKSNRERSRCDAGPT